MKGLKNEDAYSSDVRWFHNWKANVHISHLY